MSSVHFAVFDPAAGKQLRSVDAAGATPPVWTAGRPVVGGLGTPKLSLWDANTLRFQGYLEGHTAAVSAVAWSRDGNTLASADYANTIHVWEAKSGNLAHKLTGHKAPISALAWSPDGKTLASASHDKTVMLWSAKGEAVATLEGHTEPVMALAWRSGISLASGGNDQTIIVWDTVKKRQVRMIQAYKAVQSLAWTMMGRTAALACGTSDDTVRIYNGTTGQQVAGLASPSSPPNVASVAWRPGAGMLLSGRSCHVVQLWDLEAEKPIQSLAAMAPVQYVAWGSNGATLVSGNSERTVRFWDAATGMPRGVLLEEKDSMAMISADGNWRWDPEKKPDLVFVVQIGETQHTMTPAEFSERFGAKSRPTRGKSG
jgi:WD40 repeat protein